MTHQEIYDAIQTYMKDKAIVGINTSNGNRIEGVIYGTHKIIVPEMKDRSFTYYKVKVITSRMEVDWFLNGITLVSPGDITHVEYLRDGSAVSIVE